MQHELEPSADDARSASLSELLEAALARQRENFDILVEEGALQLACAAHQELMEIHEAQPTEPLRLAIDRLRESIAALRALAAVQRSMHEQLVIDAEGAISDAAGRAAPAH